MKCIFKSAGTYFTCLGRLLRLCAWIFDRRNTNFIGR